MKASIKTPTQMAKLMNISLSTMYKILNTDDTFPARKFGGKWYIDENQLGQWIKTRKKTNGRQISLF